MSKITPYLWLGDADNAQNLQFLQSIHAELIVNCAKEVPNYYPQLFRYEHLNLDDHPKQNLSAALNSTADLIINAMRNRKVVFVHCFMGISRSSSIVIYVIMKLHKWNYSRAFDFVKSLHPNTNPNPGFVEQLIKRNLSSQSETMPIKTVNQNINHETELIENYAENESRYEIEKNEKQQYYQPTESIYSRLDAPKAPSKKEGWSKLTFDCPECDLPEYSSGAGKRGTYARIFA